MNDFDRFDRNVKRGIAGIGCFIFVWYAVILAVIAGLGYAGFHYLTTH